VRPAYLARFTELTKTASDENVNALLAFSVKQGEEALKIHPQLCANLAAGAADIRVQQFPKAISDEEVRIMARILRAGQQQEEGASADEVGVWVTKFSLANPDAMTGLGMIGQPGITDDQARIVCEGNLALMRNLLKEEPALRARLFRGLLALA
jgi:hypothetical protein